MAEGQSLRSIADPASMSRTLAHFSSSGAFAFSWRASQRSRGPLPSAGRPRRRANWPRLKRESAIGVAVRLEDPLADREAPRVVLLGQPAVPLDLCLGRLRPARGLGLDRLPVHAASPGCVDVAQVVQQPGPRVGLQLRQGLADLDRPVQRRLGLGVLAAG